MERFEENDNPYADPFCMYCLKTMGYCECEKCEDCGQFFHKSKIFNLSYKGDKYHPCYDCFSLHFKTKYWRMP